ncbi:MAG: hypothetical protein U0V56_10265 [Actinomycetota bacterium]
MDPGLGTAGEHPFRLDSKPPSVLADFAMKEARYAMLARTDPFRALEQLMGQASVIDARLAPVRAAAGIDRGAQAR